MTINDHETKKPECMAKVFLKQKKIIYMFLWHKNRKTSLYVCLNQGLDETSQINNSNFQATKGLWHLELPRHL
jgi:hypothetical protein